MKTKKVVNINDLEAILKNYHNNHCWDETKKWFNQFGNNIRERSRFLKANMYTPKPISTADGGGKVNEFSVLQGDVIKTKAAITSNPLFDFAPLEYSYYLIVPSSCSVQPNRYKQVLLARLSPIESIENEMKNVFLQSVRFENVKTFYLPPIDGEKLGEFGFVAIFEEISYIENELLQSALRLLAPLSRIGWHLLNAFDDITLRQSIHENEWGFYE